MDYLYTLGYILISVVLIFIGKLIYQFNNKSINVNHELVEKDNFAFSLSYVGYFVALIIIIGAALIGPSKGFIEDIITISIYSGLGIVFLNISILINNKFILRKFNVQKEIIEDQNAGTGIVEAAVYISSGLILFGAIIGESTSYLEGIITASVYWIIGMLILIITSYIYSKITNYDVHDEIEKDNVAAGVAFAGSLVAIAIILMDALSEPFLSWDVSLREIGIEVVIGIVMLPIMRVVADKILLPGQNLTDEIVNQEKPNVGAALVEALAYIGFALIISWSY